jgi:hypothetical protein
MKMIGDRNFDVCAFLVWIVYAEIRRFVSPVSRTFLYELKLSHARYRFAAFS